MFGHRNRELEHKLDLIYTALLVRDPGVSMASEAYEGLRRQVIAAASERQAHVVQLAEIDVALRRGARLAELRSMVEQWLRQSGVTVVDDPRAAGCFESSGIDPRHARVDIPAYVVTASGQVIRQGRLREEPPEPPTTGQVTSARMVTTAQPDAIDSEADTLLAVDDGSLHVEGRITFEDVGHPAHPPSMAAESRVATDDSASAEEKR